MKIRLLPIALLVMALLMALTLTPAESAKAVVSFIESLSADKGGRFFTRNGEEIPW